MLKKVEVPKPLLAPRQIEISPRLPAEFEDIKLPVLERRARIFNSIDHHCAACLCKVSAKDEGSAIHLAKVYFPEIVEDSNGKISQIRVGKDGELITIDKLKTMHADGNLDDKDMKRARRVRGGKATTDSRITPIGKIARKFWVDELPQIASLLSGDLNIVGIRPHLPVEFLIRPYELQCELIRHPPGLVNATYYKPTAKGHNARAKAEKRFLKKKNKTEFPALFDMKYIMVIAARIMFKNQRGG